MRRVLMVGTLSLVVVACRPYDFYDPIASQSGLVPASQYARYGIEQSQAMAIARSLGQWNGGSGFDARAVMVSKAADYAKTLPAVASVVADTQGYRLTVTFKSGWRTFVLPVNDGVKPEDTSAKRK
jgi:hypothetical protein